ncbi:MAG: monovalent cation/H+ antiporter complex subunit F [Actinomycetota bacterium]|nr:monovalent cation/H+ antiporter complex subunit F [Actinomycetota bacterium]
MTTVVPVALAVLAVNAALCLARLVRRGSLADRVIALDMLLVVVVQGVALQSIWTGEGAFLDVMVIIALIAFVGTATMARFIERRGG